MMETVCSINMYSYVVPSKQR